MKNLKAKEVREKLLEKRRIATKYKNKNEKWLFDFILNQIESMDELNCFSFLKIDQDKVLTIGGDRFCEEIILGSLYYDEKALIKLEKLFNAEEGYLAKYDCENKIFTLEITD